MRYEGYGPNAIAVIVEALTDNRNRTAGEVRAVFTKRGGNMGETNSVSFMFDRLGEIIFPASVASADDMFEAAVEAGAENVESDDDEHVIYTAPDDFMAVLNALQEKLGDAKQAELTFKANIEKELNAEEAQQILDMIEAFEDIDDVQSVYTNMSVSDEVMAKLEAAE
jgi:YebC/PmpR family DNA-binding regulatory protein